MTVIAAISMSATPKGICYNMFISQNKGEVLMIVYYKRMANALMLLGAILGGALGFFYFHGQILTNADKTTVFWWALWIFAGIILGRLFGAILANRRLQKVQKQLYVDADPAGFLKNFEGVNARVPKNLAEYANGQHWISYAKEALGDFEGAWDAIKDLRPEELRVHALTSSALIVNQKANLQILRGDLEAAGFQIEDLRHLEELSVKRAARLAENLKQQIRVHEARIAAAEGRADADIPYLEEEVQYAGNAIYRKEIQLELAEYALRTGNAEKAKAYLQAILSDRKGLYTETRAEELLAHPENVRSYQKSVRNENGEKVGEEDQDGFVVIRE